MIASNNLSASKAKNVTCPDQDVEIFTRQQQLDDICLLNVSTMHNYCKYFPKVYTNSHMQLLRKEVKTVKGI